MILVTKTYLPPKTEYDFYLDKIWESKWITNNGPLVKELEEKLAHYFGVKHLFFVSNGTIAIQIALRVLEVNGEVITTPYSYVATTSAVLWEKLKPKFVDIDPITFCIDPKKVEENITENTKAILATHVYGIPCDVKALELISKKYNIPLIYDAAHAFGSEYNNRSVVSFGDISTLSFHATKLFHTIEGGAIVTNSDDLAKKIRLSRSFGHINDDHFSLGINAKNSEFNAAMGLCLLPKIHDFIERRKHLYEVYEQGLEGLPIQRVSISDNTKYNYSYYPAIFKDEETLFKVVLDLKEVSVIPRRYFYPSLNQLPYITEIHPCAVSESVSLRALCLPMYFELAESDVKVICQTIRKTLSE
jgi:dTDP-4-amino-4,6-dideoxygalactose transaminase